MQKLKASTLIARLKGEGFRFADMTLTSSGAYAAEDADWNYKDIPHLHHVHALAEAYPTVIGKDVLCNVNVQKILGVWFPITLVIYEVAKNHFCYFTTLFFFVLVIETKAAETTPLQTTVTTTYNIGYPPLLGFLVPMLKWLLARNYKVLMRDDIPMRERRGELRRLGYTFLKEGDSYAFDETVNTGANNVAIPAGMTRSLEADYQQAFGAASVCMLGDRGLMGLRLTREGDEVTVWPLTCPHEGAELRHEDCRNNAPQCPWHGRKFNAIGRFAWGGDAAFTTGHYQVAVSGPVIRWTYVGDQQKKAAAA
jgi:nitrite reductase/ring-hydroxylating ferredoxin subunit